MAEPKTDIEKRIEKLEKDVERLKRILQVKNPEDGG